MFPKISVHENTLEWVLLTFVQYVMVRFTPVLNF